MKRLGTLQWNLRKARLRGQAEAEVVGYDTYLWSFAVLVTYIVETMIGAWLGVLFFENIWVGMGLGGVAAVLTMFTPLVRVFSTPLYRYLRGSKSA